VITSSAYCVEFDLIFNIETCGLKLTISAFIFENTGTMKCDLHRLTWKLKSPLVVRVHRFRKGITFSFLRFTFLCVLWKGNFSLLPGNVLELGSSTLDTSLNAGNIVESAKLQDPNFSAKRPVGLLSHFLLLPLLPSLALSSILHWIETAANPSLDRNRFSFSSTLPPFSLRTRNGAAL